MHVITLIYRPRQQNGSRISIHPMTLCLIRKCRYEIKYHLFTVALDTSMIPIVNTYKESVFAFFMTISIDFITLDIISSIG